MNLALASIRETFSFRRFVGEKCACYHCGESMRKAGAIIASFNGYDYPVCCHGCLAVLNAIQKNGLIDDYLRSKETMESTA
jgi:hypothetical protein